MFLLIAIRPDHSFLLKGFKDGTVRCIMCSDHDLQPFQIIEIFRKITDHGVEVRPTGVFEEDLESYAQTKAIYFSGYPLGYIMDELHRVCGDQGLAIIDNREGAINEHQCH